MWPGLLSGRAFFVPIKNPDEVTPGSSKFNTLKTLNPKTLKSIFSHKIRAFVESRNIFTFVVSNCAFVDKMAVMVDKN